MKTVKVSYIQGDEHRWGSFERQSPGRQCVWGDYKFVINQDIDECDYWLVYDIMPKTETCKCPEQNTIFITGEPPSVGVYVTPFLNQFHNIITCHFEMSRNKRVNANVFLRQQSLPWIVDKTYDELIIMDTIKKTKELSLITTTKHKKRYEAAMAIKEHFGDRIDVFGDGINPIKDKWESLAPYKYSIVMENESVSDYFTEKLTDSYLALTYPIYYGCKNLNTRLSELHNPRDEYFPRESFAQLTNLDYTERIIRRVEFILGLKGHYDQALPYLKESRRMVLNKYNLFPSVINLIESNPLCFEQDLSNKKEIKISDKGRFAKDKLMFIKKMWRNL